MPPTAGAGCANDDRNVGNPTAVSVGNAAHACYLSSKTTLKQAIDCRAGSRACPLALAAAYADNDRNRRE